MTRTCNVACGEIEVSVIFINNIRHMAMQKCVFGSVCMCM